MLLLNVTLAQAERQDELKVVNADSVEANIIPEDENGPKPTRAQNKAIMAGDYLASRFAQRKHDWGKASTFITPLFSSEISKEEVTQRAMVIAMGAGETKRALDLAHKLNEMDMEVRNAIADIFLLVEAYKKKDYEAAQKVFNAMEPDATTVFIGPFIEGWLGAAQGKVNIGSLRQNTVQLFHGILISDFLGDHKEIEMMIDASLNVEDVSVAELDRIADLYAHIGAKEKALELYNKVNKSFPDDLSIKEKINKLENGTFEPLFEKIKTPEDGLASAFYDISRVLYNESNVDSARVFAHLAKYLSSALSQSNFMLAEINTEYKQYDKAIALYKDVSKSDKNYIQAQYKIVDVYELTGQYDKALKALGELSKKEAKPDVLIRIGDLYRHQSKYDKALESYNSAIKLINGEVPNEYWHVYYVRGIAYEQTGNWDAAEKDLKKALTYQPNHPYVLNYLGYSWADQGKNLNEATNMIQRAVDARPTDGYITDSLGWAMYRNANYTNAVATLERAVELLPYDPTINDHLGDAYWKVGRRLEARFQWERAKNHSKEEEQIQSISQKLASGLLDNTDSSDKKHGIITH
jgi:tetratricopeptide (TPR) repeat protein